MQTQSDLAPSYVRLSSVVDAAAKTHAAREDHSPWLFALAPVSFALTLAGVIYLSLISF